MTGLTSWRPLTKELGQLNEILGSKRQDRRRSQQRRPGPPYKKAGNGRKITRNRLFIGLVDYKGKKHVFMVHQAVGRHFLGKLPCKEMVLHHKNGTVTDNWASNLAYIDRRSLGKKTGASSNRQPVVKINKNGEIINVYSSAREAGRQNFMSYQTINDRCNNK